jgi:hypothetical protein
MAVVTGADGPAPSGSLLSPLAAVRMTGPRCSFLVRSRAKMSWNELDPGNPPLTSEARSVVGGGDDLINSAGAVPSSTSATGAEGSPRVAFRIASPDRDRGARVGFLRFPMHISVCFQALNIDTGIRSHSPLPEVDTREDK